MTIASVRLADSVQALIDARLDTIDRMLLGRVPRPDRLAITRDLETQIFELLQDCGADEPGRDDVLAVLARLDPPEAYLPEATDAGPGTGREPAPLPYRPLTRGGPGPRVAKLSGLLGLSALALVLLMPLVYVVAALLESEAVLFVVGFGVGGVIFVGSLAGLVLGIHARRGGVWAILGVVTSLVALLFSGLAGLYVLLLLLSSG
ncbi:MAG TPA: hypothetical protein VF590_05230 [Isosphaeraceae bacterium]